MSAREVASSRWVGRLHIPKSGAKTVGMKLPVPVRPVSPVPAPAQGVRMIVKTGLQAGTRRAQLDHVGASN